MSDCSREDTDGTAESRYQAGTVSLVLNTLIEVYESEHSRVRTVEGKASMILSASGILTGLASRGLLDASSTRPWMIGPAIAAAVCLAGGVIECLRVITIAEYQRPDTGHLRKGEVLAMKPEGCGGRLIATWHEAVTSIGRCADEKIGHYKRAHMLFTISFVIALFTIVTILVELLA
jgi:hypothetical protein